MSGPWAGDEISIYGTGESLLPDDMRQLFVVVVAHQREAKANRCRDCGKPYPCQTNRNARQQLKDAGVDLDQALGTIWS